MKPTLKTLWGYGAGNFGYGLIFQIIATYFVFYATAVLGLSGALVGTIVGLGVIWDAVSDPIMGYISDGTQNKRFGRRHLYLWVGGIVIALSNLLVWNLHFGLPHWLQVGLMVLALMFVKTGMTIYGTPYTALGAELSDDHEQRLKLQSVKMVFFMLGIAFAAAGCMLLFFRPTAAYPVGQLNPLSYRYMSVVTTALMLCSMLAVIQTTKHAIPALSAAAAKQPPKRFGDFFHAMKSAFAHGDLRAIVFGYLFTNLASALLSTIGLHVYTYTFRMGNTEIALIAGAQLFVAIVSQPFWIKLNHYWDKAKAIRLGLALSIAAFVYFLLCVAMRTITAEHLWVLLPFMLLGGIGSGGLVTLPQAMVADTVDANALKTGRREEGVYYGTMTLTYKLSQSIAIFLIGYLLDWIGFNADLAVQTPFTLTALGVVMGAGSLLALVAAFVSYRHYQLNRQKMAAIHLALQQAGNI